MYSLDLHHPLPPKRRNTKRFLFDVLFLLLLLSVAVALGVNYWQRQELERLKSSFRPNAVLKRSFFLLEKNIAASILSPDQSPGLPVTNFSQLSDHIPEEDSANLALATKGSDLEQGLLALSHLQKTIADTSIPSLQKLESAKEDAATIVKAWQHASDPSLPVLLDTQQSMKSLRDLCQLFLQHESELASLLGKNEIQRWLIAFPESKDEQKGMGVELLFDEGKVISKKIVGYDLQGPPNPLTRGNQKPDALKKYWSTKIHHSLDFIVVISQDALGQFLSLEDRTDPLDMKLSSQVPPDAFYSQILEYIDRVVVNPRKLFEAIRLGEKLKIIN